jgi:hypothetical protein
MKHLIWPLLLLAHRKALNNRFNTWKNNTPQKQSPPKGNSVLYLKDIRKIRKCIIVLFIFCMYLTTYSRQLTISIFTSIDLKKKLIPGTFR